MKILVIFLFSSTLFLADLNGQNIPMNTQVGDTLVIEVGKSRLMLIVNDLDDLEKLQKYDLNKIIQRLDGKLEQDSIIVLGLNDPSMQDEDSVINENDHLSQNDEKNNNESSTSVSSDKKKKYPSYQHLFNIDVGMNNYLMNGKFPDKTDELYTVRPWGSWYIALGSTNQFKFSRSFLVEGGVNVSWYNFKFQNDAVYVNRDDQGVVLAENPENLSANFEKSKLTVAYLNASIVPVLKIGPGDSGRVRIGMGGYAGYRIGSYTKNKYDEGQTKKDKNHDSFYLNNFRYGLRFQAGFKGTDLFVNYDLNELFADGRGPQLNAFSFGVIL